MFKIVIMEYWNNGKLHNKITQNTEFRIYFRDWQKGI